MEQLDDNDALAPVIRSVAGKELLDKDIGWCVGVRGDRLMRLNTEKHMISIANTGGGKGVSAAIPNLLLHEGSVLSVEIGGATYKETVNYRRAEMKQNIQLIDPFGATGEPSAHINLLDTIDPNSPSFFIDIDSFTDSIMQDRDGHKESNPYWERQPRSLLSALLTYVTVSPNVPDEDRHLPYIYQLLSRFPGDEWQELMRDFSVYSGPNSANVHLIGNYFNVSGPPDENIRGIVSSVQGAMRFASDDKLVEIISDSSFSLKQLQAEPTATPLLDSPKLSVYVVMPDPKAYKVHSTFLRLLIERSMAACSNKGDGGFGFKTTHQRVLFMLDEFTQLGKLDCVDEGMQTARQKGVTFWVLFQDLGRLRSLYGDNLASSFMGAAGCVQIFDVGDDITPKYVSERLGKRIVYLPGVQSTLSVGQNNSINWSDSISRGDSETFSQGQTLGDTETWNEGEAYGSGVSSGSSHTDGASHGTNSSEGDAKTKGTSDGTGTAKAKTKGKATGDMFGLNYHGHIARKKTKKTIKDKDDRERTYQKSTGSQESDAETKSTQKSDTVSDTHSTNAGVTDSTQSSDTTQFAQSFNFTKNISRGGTRSVSGNVGVASGVSSQNTAAKGGGSGTSKTASYSLSYTPHILPQLDPTQVAEVLGSDKRQVLFIRAKSDDGKNDFVLNMIDRRALFHENSVLSERASGPIAKPVPEMVYELPAPSQPTLIPRQTLVLEVPRTLEDIATLHLRTFGLCDIFDRRTDVDEEANTAAQHLRAAFTANTTHNRSKAYEHLVQAAPLMELNAARIEAERGRDLKEVQAAATKQEVLHGLLAKYGSRLDEYRMHVKTRQQSVAETRKVLALYESALLADIGQEREFEEELWHYRAYLERLHKLRSEWPHVEAPIRGALDDLGEDNYTAVDLDALERQIHDGTLRAATLYVAKPLPSVPTFARLAPSPDGLTQMAILFELGITPHPVTAKSMADMAKAIDDFKTHPLRDSLSRDAFIKKLFFGNKSRSDYEKTRTYLADTVIKYLFEAITSLQREEQQRAAWYTSNASIVLRNKHNQEVYAAELIQQRGLLDKLNDNAEQEGHALAARYRELRQLQRSLEIRRVQSHNQLMVSPAWSALEAQTATQR